MSGFFASVCMLLHLACGEPEPVAATPRPAPASAVSAPAATAPPHARRTTRTRPAGKAASDARASPPPRRRSPDCRAHACALPNLPPWPSAPYRYSTSGASLPDTLRALSAATHVPIAFDAGLPGRVEGRFELPPQRFVEMLAHGYGLVWYYDGTVLHVDAAGTQTTLIVRLNYARPADLHALLAQTGIDDVRFVARDDTPTRGLITFRGPPAWIALVGRAAQRLDADARARVKTAVRIVPLRYGNAADRTAFANGRTNVVQGVATRAARVLDPQDSLRATITEYEAPLPALGADAGTNAVLVRDRPERLDADVRAIVALDRPRQHVGVGLLVAEVDADALGAIGLGAQGATVMRARAARNLGAALRGTPGVRMLTDSALQTDDGVAVAWERHVEQPVAPTGGQRDPAASDGTAAATVAASDPGPATDDALRIVPALDMRTEPPRVVLAVEWRGAAIDVARASLGPGEMLAMVEPGASAPAAGHGSMRVILLAPHPVDGCASLAEAGERAPPGQPAAACR
ncbi:secretin N-terminal domain-containing protein [Burkholderia pyrrocinia]|uniref:secretin N-terminal domain-containing protein n=1 Tax=Burkholderia pyrrocinia TaxID=60550 RepID=UPI00158E7B50|nr:secretin N-terminal domain-containing protein [Burkholderia pyrrocinia]